MLTLATGMGASGAEMEPAEALYVRALHTMAELPVPPYVTYRVAGKSEGLRANLVANNTCLVQVTSGTNTVDWAVQHRTADHATLIVDRANDVHLRNDDSLFDPTWNGAYRELRRGIIASSCHPLMPSASPTPTTAPSANPDVDTLRTIAVVSVLGPGIYRVDDRGAATCPDGRPGRALHLRSRDHDANHQLSDVIIDDRSTRFCMVRFGRPSGIGLGASVFVEDHYRDVGAYWIQTDGFIELTARIFGIAAGHGMWRFTYIDMQFPPTLPDATFEASPSEAAATKAPR